MFNQIVRLLPGDSLRVFSRNFILDEDVQVLQSTLFLALADFFLSLWDQLSPSFFTGFDVSWDVSDKDGSDDLQCDYKVLKEVSYFCSIFKENSISENVADLNENVWNTSR